MCETISVSFIGSWARCVQSRPSETINLSRVYCSTLPNAMLFGGSRELDKIDRRHGSRKHKQKRRRFWALWTPITTVWLIASRNRVNVRLHQNNNKLDDFNLKTTRLPSLAPERAVNLSLEFLIVGEANEHDERRITFGLWVTSRCFHAVNETQLFLLNWLVIPNPLNEKWQGCQNLQALSPEIRFWHQTLEFLSITTN